MHKFIGFYFVNIVLRLDKGLVTRYKKTSNQDWGTVFHVSCFFPNAPSMVFNGFHPIPTFDFSWFISVFYLDKVAVLKRDFSCSYPSFRKINSTCQNRRKIKQQKQPNYNSQVAHQRNHKISSGRAHSGNRVIFIALRF